MAGAALQHALVVQEHRTQQKKELQLRQRSSPAHQKFIEIVQNPSYMLGPMIVSTGESVEGKHVLVVQQLILQRVIASIATAAGRGTFLLKDLLQSGCRAFRHRSHTIS